VKRSTIEAEKPKITERFASFAPYFSFNISVAKNILP
jgi:hypothetical protein